MGRLSQKATKDLKLKRQGEDRHGVKKGFLWWLKKQKATKSVLFCIPILRPLSHSSQGFDQDTI